MSIKSRSKRHKIDTFITLTFVKVGPYIQGTLDSHCVKRSVNSNGVCFLEFYKSSNVLGPFHVQYYFRANTLVLLCANTQGQRSTKMSEFLQGTLS